MKLKSIYISYFAAHLIAAIGASSLSAQELTESDTVVLDTVFAAETPIGDIGALNNVATPSVYGLNLTITETPRSISMITGEMIDQFSVSSLNDMVKLTPGAFTSSFFGIEGSLDIRGTTSETYFRGMKRLENPGHFPTPIGAADQVEVVRGPASPVFGPGKIGGYLNFVPKSARASSGRYLDNNQGSMKLTYGSYDKRVGEFHLMGPITLPATKAAGFSVYAMLENSDSYYDNSFQDQAILQFSLDADLNDRWRFESGGMYHNWEGTENAGWNRVTQDLIDHGTYLRGRAQDFDLNDDGRVSGNEYNSVGGSFELVFVNPDGSVSSAPFGAPLSGPTNPNLALDPSDPLTGTTTKLSHSNVLIDSIDRAYSDSALLYFDLIADSDSDLTFENKSFFEYMDRWKTASYGFSQSQEQILFENKSILNQNLDLLENWEMSNSYSFSFRHFQTDYLSDFVYEHFERRDLSQGPSPRDRVWTWYERPDLNPLPGVLRETVTNNLGLGLMSQSRLWENLNIIVGGRFDYIDAESIEKNLPGRPKTSGDTTEFSYTTSASYRLPSGFIPYITVAESANLTTDQDGSIASSNVAGGSFINRQTLMEGGVKGSFFDNRLYAAVGVYQQKTSSFSDQTEANQAVKAEGVEIEARYAVNRNLTLLFNGTWQETEYKPFGNNANFNFLNTAQSGFSGEDIYGGTLGGVILDEAAFPERSGQPERVLSLSGIYALESGYGVSATVTHIASVSADRLRTIQLPEANLLDLSFFYHGEKWEFQLGINNVTDEKWYRSNFPDLFGGVVVLPQMPRTFEFSASYKF